MASKWLKSISKKFFVVIILAAVIVSPVNGKIDKSYGSIPKVGVVFSNQSVKYGNFSGPRVGNNMGKVEIGSRQKVIYDMLVSRNYSPTKVGDAGLRDLATIKKFDVLVFPYTYMLDEKQTLNIRKFVESGGGIVSVFATPRVNTNEILWYKIFSSNAWEWGPMSELYQITFINDPVLDNGFTVIPTPGRTKHPVIKRTEAVMDRAVRLVRAEPAAVEYARALGNNDNVRPILSYTNGNVAAWSGKYFKGRFIYFNFPEMDFFWHSRLDSANKNQGNVARELLIQAIKWSAQSDGQNHPIYRTARTWAEVDAWSREIYVRQSLKGTGNVQVVGDLELSIVNPSGKTVYYFKYPKLGALPGAINNNRPYSYKYAQGSTLANGTWKVISTYTDRYTGKVQQEIAYFTRNQQKVPSVPVGSVTPSVYSNWMYPNPFSPNGDGYRDTTSFCYSLSHDALVTIKVYNANGSVRTVLNNVFRSADRHYEGWNGKDNNGKVLPNGNYKYYIWAKNTHGTGSAGGVTAIKK